MIISNESMDFNDPKELDDTQLFAQLFNDPQLFDDPKVFDDPKLFVDPQLFDDPSYSMIPAIL